MKLKVCGLSCYSETPASFHILTVDTNTTLWSQLRLLPKEFLPTHSQLWLWAHLQENGFSYFPSKCFSLTQSSMALIIKKGKWCNWLAISFCSKARFFARSSKPYMIWGLTLLLPCPCGSSPMVAWLFIEYPRDTEGLWLPIVSTGSHPQIAIHRSASPWCLLSSAKPKFLLAWHITSSIQILTPLFTTWRTLSKFLNSLHLNFHIYKMDIKIVSTPWGS